MGRSRFFGVRHDRVFGGNDAGADRVGKDLGKLGPEHGFTYIQTVILFPYFLLSFAPLFNCFLSGLERSHKSN